MQPHPRPPERFTAAYDRAHEEAAAQAGASDFGAADYCLGLKILLLSLDYDPHFSATGRAIAWSQLVDALASRAVAQRHKCKNPEYVKHVIRQPIVIVGIPRTGTTALHKLLAVDPQFQGAEKWLLSSPMPRPPHDEWLSNPRFQKEVGELDARFAATPEQRVAHNMVAEEIDECLWMQRQSFCSHMWACSWSAATYDAWWQSQNEIASYHYLQQGIQLIGLNDNRRWLLKNPSHILRLEQLFGVFPDALVIQTHRDPAKAIPSLCAFLMPGHDILETDRKRERSYIMGSREVGKWEKGVRESMPVRAAHEHQILDVIHGEFHSDPMGVIRRIYAFAGLELTRNVEESMAQRIAAKPELSQGVHHYDVADYGLTEPEIREQFKDYMEAFDLRPSARA